jgi:hypothetical protein
MEASPKAAGSRGIRELLNKNPIVKVGAVLLFFVLAAVVFIQTRPNLTGRMYFSSDDGKTWFVDEAQAAPFEKDGATAYQAEVFTIDQGKTLFVGYLLRYKPEARERMNAIIRDPKSLGVLSGFEVKKPGGDKWYGPDDSGTSQFGPGYAGEGYTSVTAVTGPKGERAVRVTPDTLELVRKGG